jgi:hypothetical protein
MTDTPDVGASASSSQVTLPETPTSTQHDTSQTSSPAASRVAPRRGRPAKKKPMPQAAAAPEASAMTPATTHKGQIDLSAEAYDRWLKASKKVRERLKG